MLIKLKHKTNKKIKWTFLAEIISLKRQHQPVSNKAQGTQSEQLLMVCIIITSAKLLHLGCSAARVCERKCWCVLALSHCLGCRVSLANSRYHEFVTFIILLALNRCSCNRSARQHASSFAASFCSALPPRIASVLSNLGGGQLNFAAPGVEREILRVNLRLLLGSESD